MLMFCVLMTFSMTSFAADNESKLNELANQYGLKSISENEIPSDVKPIVIENEEELKNFMESIDKFSNESSTIELIAEDTEALDYGIQSRSGSNYVIRDFKISRNTGGKPAITLYLSAKVKVYSEGSFRSIEDVQSITTYVQGYAPGIDYSADDASTGFDINSDGRSATIWGGGNIKYYLFIEGGMKLFEDRVDIEGVFKI